MERRAFIGLVGGAAAWPVAVASGWPVTASAQQSGVRVPRVAYLGPSSAAIADPSYIEQFKVGLVENDLIVGRNIAVEYFWADGSPDRLRELANQLGRQSFDVVVTVGPQAYRFLKAAQTKSPIVLAVIGDALADGIVDNLARPTGNVTGLSMSNRDLEGKRVEILKEAAPAVKRLMILHDPSMGSSGMAEAQTVAKSLAMEAEIFEATDPSQFENAFGRALKARVDGLAAMASPLLNRHRRPLIELAARHQLPSIWEAGIYVRDGGLISYGPSFADMYRRSAGYIAKIIRGAKPEDLPIQLPIKFELVVNSRTARMLGINLPATLLTRADEVIE
jgi:putative tryptophan/tyrosine transport system substrate-binding protein